MEVKIFSSGFTLVELLVVVVILGILSSIAYPSFEAQIRDSRLASQSNTLLATLQLARSEAAATYSTLTVCPSSNQATCDNSASWKDGYIITNGTTALKVIPALEGGSTIFSSQGIAFDNRGQLIQTTPPITICDERGMNYAKGILINGSGQIRLGAAARCE